MARRGTAAAAADASAPRARGARSARRGLRRSAVGVTIWYWLSYLRGPSDTAFTRGPYLLRVSGSEAALRWRARGGKAVRVTASGPAAPRGGRAGRPARPRARHALRLDGERRRQSPRRAGVVHDAAAALDRPVRFAVLRRLRLGQRRRVGGRPRCSPPSGPSSPHRRRQLLPRRGRAPARPQHLPPAGRSHAQRAAVRLPRRSRQLLARARAICERLRPAPRAGASRCTTVRSRWSSWATSPTSRAAVAFARRPCASPGRRCASSPATARCSPATRCCRVAARGRAAAVFCGHLHRYERRTWMASRRSRSARAGRARARSLTPRPRPGGDQPARHRRADRGRAARRRIAYTFLDKHGSALDRGAL